MISVHMAAEVQINQTRFDSLFELIYVRNRKMFERLAYFQIGNEEEAKDLLATYNTKIKKQRIKELNDELMGLDEESDEYERVLREIRDLQKR